MHLTLHTTPDPAIRDRLFAMLDRYNDDATGRPEPVRHLTIPLRDATGRIEGGLVGVSYYDWLFIELLYVPPGLRGHGMGSQLMHAAEAVAARRACRGIWLDTYSFQARPFYERLGYRSFVTLPDFPPGHARHFMQRETPPARPLPPLEIHEARIPEVAAHLDRALTAYNDAIAGPGNSQALAILAHDASGAEQGGLWAIAGRGWFFLDLFVLDAPARRAGTGSRILEMAEQQARALGCTGMCLDSYGFQAPGFYRRHGFEQTGILPDYPTPWTRHFLAKRLTGSHGEA